jgi:hypothetical protein
MVHNRKFALGSLLLALALLLGMAVAVKQSAANSQGADLSTYLPFASYQQAPRGIHGLVTEGGVPAAGITVTLQLRNAANQVSQVMLDLTDANGYYSFIGAPTLANGDRYFVFYPNAEDTAARVNYWAGFLINSYTAGDEINGTDFDIANIVLTNPAPGATVTLPTTFTWNPRAASPTDSYELNIVGDSEEDADETYFYTIPPLGYVGHYTLNSLPGSMDYNETYGWTMWAYGPGGTFPTGNFGTSYYVYIVTFAESAAGNHSPAAAVRLRPDPELVFQRLTP